MEKSPRKHLTDSGDLQELRVDILGRKRSSNAQNSSMSMETRTRVAQVSSRSMDYVYVNSGYVASVHDVRRQTRQSQSRIVLPVQPPTSVVREQYWTCSKWSKAQRFLAIAVAVLFGAVVGLAIIVILNNTDDNIITKFFVTRSTPE